ncbi:MAG: sugar kinase [Pedobacter sp.]|nr:MAG: sugar kinase [Pedobacter sp.]
MGEVLIDFIGHQPNSKISKLTDYHRYLGGSPTNVAINASLLGLKTALVATCGADGLGDYIIETLNESNVITTQINRDSELPTSIMLISKGSETPDFIPFRAADGQIIKSQLPEELMVKAKILHTTCFALSLTPARETILEMAMLAHKHGLKLSIDLNYSEKIWPNKDIAIATIAEYMSYNPLVKLSSDDCFRLFGEHLTEDEIFNYFHDLGAQTVCLTKGKDGVTLSDKITGVFKQPALQINDIKDTTGAGDAFWTGFLYGYINEESLSNSITLAQKIAAIKLGNLGPLKQNIDMKSLLLN